MMLIKKALKENDEDVIRMKLLCPDNKMPADFLKNSDIKISTGTNFNCYLFSH